MKRNCTAPDSLQLRPPGRKDTADFISLILFYYFLASVGGYLWEVLLFLGKDGDFCNRGFLYGPWLPVYGVGAVLLYFFFRGIKNHPVRVFLLSALAGSCLELLVGWLLDTVWDLCYWDYSSYPWNFFGYICLYSALGFGIAGALWVCLLSGLLEKLWFRFPRSIRYAFNSLLILLLLLDIAAALIFPNTGAGITFPQ